MRHVFGVGLLAFALAMAASWSEASRWTFEQAGWRLINGPLTGGIATGFFEGTDSDANGLLEISEVTDFLLSFDGDAIVQDFQHDKTDLEFFKYTIGTQGFPPSFPFFSDNGSFFYDADDGTLGISAGQTTEPRALLSTAEPMKVTLVPVSPSLPLLATGVIAIAMTGRRKFLT